MGYADGDRFSAKFSFPDGLAFDSYGNLFVCDVYNRRIRKITPAGIVSTFAGNGSRGFADGPGATAMFYGPVEIAIDSADNLYVADAESNRIRKITPNGSVTTYAGTGLNSLIDGFRTSSSTANPNEVAVDASGNLYFTDKSKTVRKIDGSTGQVSTLAGSGFVGSADGIGESASFSGPTFLTVDLAGNLFVSDSSNGRIRKVTPSGIVTTIFTRDRYSGAYVPVDNILGICIDASGNLYAAQSVNGRILKVDPEGFTTVIAGNGQFGYADGDGGVAQFYYPVDIVVDSAGNLYVSDYFDSRIRKIMPSLSSTVIAFNQTSTLATATPTINVPSSAFKSMPIFAIVLQAAMLFLSVTWVYSL